MAHHIAGVPMIPDSLAAATEGSRELDAEVLWEVFPVNRKAVFDGVRHVSTMTGRGGEPWFNPLSDRTDVPRYTTSVDAALTLVPNGAFWRVGHDGEGADPSVYKASVMPDGRSFNAWGETAALALCAAALRARAQGAA